MLRPNHGRRTVSAVAAATLAAGLLTVGSAASAPFNATAHAATAQPAAALGAPRLTADTNARCNAPQRPGHARCFAIVRTAADHDIAAAAAAAVDGPPSGALGPSDIQSAYNLPAGAGAGKTIAIVDAFGDSHAESDLAAFRSFYGLPPCTTANGCFRKADQSGGTNYPADDSGWAMETSLDVDAVSAACPACNILLVESSTNQDSDMAAAENEAVALGAMYISNSYGDNEDPGLMTLDGAYDHPGVVIGVSTGDTGNMVEWPSSEPVVTAVGGTTLTRDSGSNRGWDETVWGSGSGGSGAGSGCSVMEPQPSFQAGIATDCARRATADISADADPATGLAIYDTVGGNGWMQVGGTSLAAPLVTTMYAMAGTPEAGTYPVTYPYHDTRQSADINDVTAGSNGSCGNVLCNAGTGWDGPTGLGSPNGLGALTGGPQGTITGEVTDAATGNPIAGVKVSASPGGYASRTDASGHYTIDAAAGTYSMTTSLYAYNDASADGVQVTADGTVTENFSLTSQPHSVVSGTVADAGHGWPVYAKITIGGSYPYGPVYTDPFTGRFSVTLAGPASYPIQVTAAKPAVTTVPGDGYQTISANLDAGATAQTRNFALKPDTAACTAPGYGPRGLTETFANWPGRTPREGWTVSGSANGWRFDDPGNRPAPTEGAGIGQFATADSSLSGGRTATTLTSPAVDLSGQATPEVSFDSGYFGAPGQQAQVQVSADNGAHWTAVWQRTTANAVGAVTIPLPEAAGKPAVKVRFSYTGQHAWWWSVGLVLIGTPGCFAQPGGLVTGLIANQATGGGTGMPVNGAVIVSAARPAATSVSADTYGDPAVAGGLYQVFLPSGAQQLTATATGYAGQNATIAVTDGKLTRHDWTLAPSTASTTSVASQGSTLGVGLTAPIGGAAWGADGAPGTASSSSTAESAGAHESHGVVARAPDNVAETADHLGRRPTPAPAARTVRLPGLTGSAYTVTLITGDQIRLTASGTGRYTVTEPSPADGLGVQVTGTSRPDGTVKTLSATPIAASSLIARGLLDRGLFDLTWLVRHGGTGPDAALPLELHYGGHPSAATLTRDAGSLPGVSVTSVSAAAGTASITVPASKATAFWRAVTGTAAAAMPATLASGITGVQLVGHREGNRGAAPADGTATYTVTETIIAPDKGNRCGVFDTARFCAGGFEMSGLTGAGASYEYAGSLPACASESCAVIEVTYQVPAGIYTGFGTGLFFDHGGSNTEQVDLTIPRLVVAGNTNVTVDARDARQLSAGGTPRPSQIANMDQLRYSTAPSTTGDLQSGAAANELSFGLAYGTSYLAIPSPPMVTIGNYDAGFRWLQRNPLLSMNVTAPSRQALHPFYPYWTSYQNADGSERTFAHFAGSKAYDVVYAGYGNDSDFANIDARGKLVLVHVRNDDACHMESSTLQRAQQAGAVGVLADPRYPGILPQGACPLPILPGSWAYSDEPAVNLPYASLPADEAAALEADLSRGQVRVHLADGGNARYWYNLAFTSESESPVRLQTGVAGNQLQEVTMRLHAASPAWYNPNWSPVRPDEWTGAGMWSPQAAPAAVTSYFGPVDPAEVWMRGSDDPVEPRRDDVFASGGTGRTETWWDNPALVGTPLPWKAAISAQPGYKFANFCAMCMQGDAFYPFMNEVAGSDPALAYGSGVDMPGVMHMYRDGQEIEQTAPLGAPVFQFPAGRANYRFTAGTGNTFTDWQFSTAPPATDRTPPGFSCFFEYFRVSGDPCAAAPLIFLRYDALTTMASTVPAGGERELRVTPYYQANPAPAKITALKVWVSLNDGATWQAAPVSAKDGYYGVRYRIPADAKGTVSMHVQAADSAGNTVDQTVYDAAGIG